MLLDASEDTLMARYADGEDRAVGELFDRFAPRVLAFLRCRHSEQQAEQFLLSTFVQLHRLRNTYSRGSPARAWVLCIAADVQRREARRVRSLQPPRAQHTLTSAAAESQHDRMLREAFAQLPDLDRQLLHLHRFEGLSFAEIAQVLGASEAVIRARATRAYRQLRARLLSLMSDGGRS